MKSSASCSDASASIAAASRSPILAGKTAIVVDDGAATGASMLFAIYALRALGPMSIVAADSLFYAEQNARVVRNAEAYYRAPSPTARIRGTCTIGIWRRRSAPSPSTWPAAAGRLPRDVSVGALRSRAASATKGPKCLNECAVFTARPAPDALRPERTRGCARVATSADARAPSP